MKSIKLLVTAYIGVTVAAALCSTVDYIPSFEGPLTVVNSDSNVTEQSFWAISLTSPITAPACSTSGYVSQFYADYACLTVFPYFTEIITTETGCIYGYTAVNSTTGENSQAVQVNLVCDINSEFLSVNDYVVFGTSESGLPTYLINAYYSGVCSASSGTSSTTTTSDTSADNSPTVQPPTDPTVAPYPTIAPFTADMTPIWILIYVAIGLLVGSVLVFLVILSFIAIRRRRNNHNGYKSIDEDFKKAAPLPIYEGTLNEEGQSLYA